MLASGERREVRRGPDGVDYQFSNASEKPSGSGWVAVNKSQFPRVRVYNWMRSADNIKSDRKKVDDEAKRLLAQPSTVSAAVAQFFDFKKYIDIDKMRQAMRASAEEARGQTGRKYAPGDRVKMDGKSYYVVRGKDITGGIKIKDPVTGEELSVDPKSITEAPANGIVYANGQVVQITKGAVDSRKPILAEILGFDGSKNKYLANIFGSTDQIEIYPEAVDGPVDAAKENIEKIAAKDRRESTRFRDSVDRQIVEALLRANLDNRTAVGIKELQDDLKATSGISVGEHTILRVAAELGQLNGRINYNAATGQVYIGNSRMTLKYLTDVTGANKFKAFGYKNLTAASDKEVYARSGLAVELKKPIVDKNHNQITSGKVVKIEGFKAFIKDALGITHLTDLRNLVDADSRRMVIPDPVGSTSFGPVNRSTFWILRDREACQNIKVGDMVTTIPNTLALPDKKGKISEKLRARVVDVQQDGFVRIKMPDTPNGKLYMVSPRLLNLSRKMESIDDIHQLLIMRPGSVYGSHFILPGAEMEFGDRQRSKSTGANRFVTVKFNNGAEYLRREDEYFSGLNVTSATFGGTSVLPPAGNYPPNYSLVPSETLMQMIRRMYPNAGMIKIARDANVPKDQFEMVGRPVSIKISIDDPSAVGKSYDVGNLLKAYYPTTPEYPFTADKASPDSSIRISHDNENVYIQLSKKHAEFQSPFVPVIRKTLKDVKGMTDYTPISKPTFQDIVSTPHYVKQLSWMLGIADDAKRMQLVKDSSIFTYDPLHDRYRVDISNYDNAHNFLRKFFGAEYEMNAYETENGGTYAGAANKTLQKNFKDYMRQEREVLAAKSDVTPIKLNGAKLTLRPYQLKAVNFLSRQKRALLAMDQGTGKTPTIIADCVRSLNEWDKTWDGKPETKDKILVVAPASVVKTAWETDLNKFLGLGPDADAEPRYGYAMLMGGNRTAEYSKLVNDPKTRIGLISYDTLRRDFKELKALGFRKIIIDEAQTIKKGNSDEEKRDAADITEKIKVVADEIPERIAATGTPLENHPSDLQSILDFIDPETFGDMGKFNSDFVDYDYSDYTDSFGRKQHRLIGISLKNTTALKSRLSRVTFRVTKDDLRQDTYGEHEGQVPKRAVLPVVGLTTVNNKQVLQYSNADDVIDIRGNSDYGTYGRLVGMAKEAMKKDFLERKRQGKNVNYRSMFVRLQQAINDPSLLTHVYGKQFDTSAIPGYHNPKIDRLHTLLGEHFNNPANGKVIVFAEHLRTINFIKQHLASRFPHLAHSIMTFTGDAAMNEKAFKQDEDNISRADAAGITPGDFAEKDVGKANQKKRIEAVFNDPKSPFKILLANEAAETGINLPAANTVINYDIPWNPQAVNQRIDRAHRVRSAAAAKASGIPIRSVTAHSLIVADKGGEINSTIESRKLASHVTKAQMFNALINQAAQGKDVTEPKISVMDDKEMAVEELLGLTKETVGTFNPERAAAARAERERGQREQSRLRRIYGHFSRYIK